MAWKLRKDKLQEGATAETADPADTTAATEPGQDTAAFAPSPLSFDSPEPTYAQVEEPSFPPSPFAHDFAPPSEAAAEPPISQAQPEEPMFAPLSFEPDMNPFVFVAPEPDTEPLIQEPSFAPPFTEEAVPAPFMMDGGDVGVEEPQFVTQEPAFTEAPLSAGPFAPFQAEEATPLEAPPAAPFLTLDREEVAPSLVHTEAESGIPRVAPFIVDVPPVPEAAPPLEGRLTVRIGNFSANFNLTKDVTVIGRPDSLLQSYPDVEIELDDAVSRRHAEIRRQDGTFALVDLRSTNGTLLNGERLDPHREYRLEHGDRIHLGDRTEIVIE